MPPVRGCVLIEWDLLRLEGYASTTSEEIDGILYVDAELTDVSVPACGCATPNIKKHGPRTINVKDFPIQRVPTVIRVKFQRYRCQSCRKVIQPPLPGISTKRDITERFLACVEKDTVKMRFDLAATVNGVENAFAIRVFDDYAEKMLSNYTFDLPRVLGMDEKHIGGRARFVVGIGHNLFGDITHPFLLNLIAGILWTTDGSMDGCSAMNARQSPNDARPAAMSSSRHFSAMRHMKPHTPRSLAAARS